ncbi:hypothetical protein Pcinc_042196 [Petrolisthes cinctipes]|uniref:Uncharacterized protein n=1 Tax=Petrolisthes cinctipes TaxID=88211 RepID=A0AAE1BJ87_PETCI|nr:hypothetical protein Pcinc_042196 [Petrolisthes cinctipes]
MGGGCVRGSVREMGRLGCPGVCVVCLSFSFSPPRHRRHRPSLTHTPAAAHHKMAVSGLTRGTPRPNSGHFFSQAPPLIAAGKYSFIISTRVLVMPTLSSLVCLFNVSVSFEL